MAEFANMIKSRERIKAKLNSWPLGIFSRNTAVSRAKYSRTERKRHYSVSLSDSVD